jgi:hypothetical protein
MLKETLAATQMSHSVRCAPHFSPFSFSGRPLVKRPQGEFAVGKGIRRIARDLGAGVGTVHIRVKAEMAAGIDVVSLLDPR